MTGVGHSEELEFPEYGVLAYVHDGRYAAFTAVLSVLHARGLIDAGRPGTIRRIETANDGPTNGFERSIWRALHGFESPGTFVADPIVDTLLNALRQHCHRLGLIHTAVPVRSFTPSRTPAGRDLLEVAARDCPWPPSSEVSERSPEDVGIAIALYGKDALKVLLPDFARGSGLLTRERNDDWSPGALNSSGPYY